uniref:Uncharacterized protein n=1 Tax=Trepomonas sp. PC1 TaxID=1076344 RepID=A0A146JWF3_9EUKA|eukprot:JAP88747.1 Hypothetical protein TPC1_31758 [Trepomonas sp. PC1]
MIVLAQNVMESVFLGIQFTENEMVAAVYSNQIFEILEPIQLPSQFRLFYGLKPSQANQLALKQSNYEIQNQELLFEQKSLMEHLVLAVRKLKSMLLEKYPNAQFNLVIAIPSFYNDFQKSLLLNTFKQLNFTVQLINEPSAMGMFIQNQQSPKNFAVVLNSQFETQIGILKLQNSFLQVQSVAGEVKNQSSQLQLIKDEFQQASRKYRDVFMLEGQQLDQLEYQVKWVEKLAICKGAALQSSSLQKFAQKALQTAETEVSQQIQEKKENIKQTKQTKQTNKKEEIDFDSFDEKFDREFERQKEGFMQVW